MANHASSKKRARQNPKRAAVNKARLSRIRTFIKKVDQAIANKNPDEAQKALEQARPEIDRGAAKGVISKNSASRKKSRLSHHIKNLKKTG